MDWVKEDLEYIWHPGSQMKDYEDLPPIVIERGEGLWLYDTEGRRYADVVSSWWCNLLGHCHPKINAAVKNQVDTLEHVIFANFTHKPAIELCRGLAKLVPPGLKKFFFTDNGSSAIEVALKMSFQYYLQTGRPQKRKFMALTGAYHGETLGALSVSGLSLNASVYQPLLLDIIRVQGPDCYRCPYGLTRESCRAECFEQAEAALALHGRETCGFIVEPLVQAAAGMRIYPPVYLKKLREACDAFDVHLIADEIAVGYGRTGKMFACDHAGISPDIMCLSKGLTGGYMPMALAVTTQKIYDAFYADYNEGKGFMHSHTYCGNPLACSAGVAVLETLAQDDILANARANAEYFHKLAIEMLEPESHVGEIRHIGLINAIELVADKRAKTPLNPEKRTGYRIYKEALKMGLILRPLGDVLYFNPPLNITRAEMDFVVQTTLRAMGKIWDD